MATVRGGLVRVVETLAAHQAERHKVIVLAPPAVLRQTEIPGVTCQNMSLWGNTDVSGHARLLRLLRTFSPDVVILHAASPGELSVAAALLSCSYHTMLVEHTAEHYPLAHPLKDRIFAVLKQRSHLWATVSEHSARTFEERWRLPVGSMVTLRNGSDSPDDEPPSEDSLRDTINRSSVIAAFGRPLAEKGFDTFVHCAGRLASDFPGYAWLWFGADAPSRVGAVQILPWTPNVGWILRRCDLVLVPSRCEALPLVVLEAWACSAAVVASRVGGIPEIVHHKVNGMLVAAEDLTGWISTIREVLTDEHARGRLAEGGHSTWQREFTAEAMAGRYEAAIRGIVGTSSRRD